MAELTGRCQCGAISWSSPGPVLWAVHCHCESCRRGNSAAYASFFGVPRSTITRKGKMTLHHSSKGVVRGFCPHCGSQMLYENEIWPDETHLYAASLDDPDHFKPTAHVHWAERVNWMSVDDNLPKYPGSADTTEPL